MIFWVTSTYIITQIFCSYIFTKNFEKFMKTKYCISNYFVTQIFCSYIFTNFFWKIYENKILYLSNFWVISNYFVPQIFPPYIFMNIFWNKCFIYKIFLKVLSSGKWRLFWGRLETKTKFKFKIIWVLLFFWNFCLRFEFCPGSPISHYFRTFAILLKYWY